MQPGSARSHSAAVITWSIRMYFDPFVIGARFRHYCATFTAKYLACQDRWRTHGHLTQYELCSNCRSEVYVTFETIFLVLLSSFHLMKLRSSHKSLWATYHSLMARSLHLKGASMTDRSESGLVRRQTGGAFPRTDQIDAEMNRCEARRTLSVTACRLSHGAGIVQKGEIIRRLPIVYEFVTDTAERDDAIRPQLGRSLPTTASSAFCVSPSAGDSGAAASRSRATGRFRAASSIRNRRYSLIERWIAASSGLCEDSINARCQGTCR